MECSDQSGVSAGLGFGGVRRRHRESVDDELTADMVDHRER
jgi:hypothetical protein